MDCYEGRPLRSYGQVHSMRILFGSVPDICTNRQRDRISTGPNLSGPKRDREPDWMVRRSPVASRLLPWMSSMRNGMSKRSAVRLDSGNGQRVARIQEIANMEAEVGEKDLNQKSDAAKSFAFADRRRAKTRHKEDATRFVSPPCVR